MATTLIVSDLHLGARNSQAVSLSGLLETDFDRLILNGDTVDNLNLKRLRPQDWAVLSQLRTIARKRELVLIRGNHEGMHTGDRPTFGPLDVLGELVQAELCEEYFLTVGRLRYVVLHGDRFDRTLNLTWIGDVADGCYQFFQRCSRRMARWLKRRVKHWGGVVASVKAGAVAYARQLGCHGVITGHTHYHDEDRVDDIHYLNSGCWVDWPCTYLRVEGGQIRLCRWLEAEPAACNSHPLLDRNAEPIPPVAPFLPALPRTLAMNLQRNES